MFVAHTHMRMHVRSHTPTYTISLHGVKWLIVGNVLRLIQFIEEYNGSALIYCNLHPWKFSLENTNVKKIIE